MEEQQTHKLFMCVHTPGVCRLSVGLHGGSFTSFTCVVVHVSVSLQACEDIYKRKLQPEYFLISGESLKRVVEGGRVCFCSHHDHYYWVFFWCSQGSTNMETSRTPASAPEGHRFLLSLPPTSRNNKTIYFEMFQSSFCLYLQTTTLFSQMIFWRSADNRTSCLVQPCLLMLSLSHLAASSCSINKPEDITSIWTVSDPFRGVKTLRHHMNPNLKLIHHLFV